MILRRAIYWLLGAMLGTCLALATWVAIFTDLVILLRYANNPDYPAMQ